MGRATSIRCLLKTIYTHLEVAHGEKPVLWAVVAGIRSRIWHEEFNVDKTSLCEQYLF